MHEKHGNESNQSWSIYKKSGNSNWLIGSIYEGIPISFPSDIETNPKQCMAVTLRSGKEVDEPKNFEKHETQVRHKILEAEKEKEETEIEEMMEAEIDVNRKGEQQKSNEVVPGLFSTTLLYTLHHCHFPINLKKPSWMLNLPSF